MISLVNPFIGSILIKKGNNFTDENGNLFPFIHGVNRIVNESNYTDNFLEVDSGPGRLYYLREKFFVATIKGVKQ